MLLRSFNTKCFASPIICSVDSIAARQVGAAFEAMLLEECLKPLAQGNDSLGNYGIEAVSRAIAQHDAVGFGAVLASRLLPDAR